MAEEKHEPKYLDLSAHSEINLAELLMKQAAPKPPDEDTQQEDTKDGDHD